MIRMQRIIKEDIERICEEELPWHVLRHRRILVTGASGFLGTYIVLSLMECNRRYKTDITINALCRNKEKAYTKFKEYWDNDHLQFVFQDVCEEIGDKYKSDLIIHAASPANPYIIQKQPYDVVKANVLGYNRLLEKAQEWGTRELVLFSSSAVYGYSSPKSGADENYREPIDFTHVKDVYCLSKQMCEMMSVCFEKTYGIEIKTIRPFVVYGPGDDLTNKKAMTDFLNDCLAGRNIVLKSKGDVVRSYIYIADAISAFFFILLKGYGGAYNISSDKNVYSIRQMARFFCECNGDTTIEYSIENKDYLNNRTQSMTGKNDKMKELGWSEKTSLKEGITRTIIWGKEIMEKKEGPYE